MAMNVLAVLEEGIDPNWLRTHLPSQESLAIEVADGLREGWLRAQSSAAEVMVIACRECTSEVISLVSHAAGENPERPVVVLCLHGPGAMSRAFAAGADDLLLMDGETSNGHVGSEEVLFVLQKALARRAKSTGQEQDLATMICVLGPKGGIGKTLTSANLAVALADRGHRVALVDLDLQFGDLGLSMGLNPERTIYDLATSGGTIDAEKLSGFLSTHSSGARVLLAPNRPDQASYIKIDFLREVYSALRASHEFVIVDTPPGFTPEVIATIDASTQVCMVGMLDALSLKNTKLGLETLTLMDYDPERIRMVLNRADSSVGITHNDVVSILGRPPDVLVPSHRDITRSVNDGSPIALSSKRSEAAKAFQSLTDIYLSTRAGQPVHQPHRSLLGRVRD
jgi:pilus assembly protein CpaE